MSNAELASRSKSVAVTIIGLTTLLLGGAYTAVGGWFVSAGADWLEHPSTDPWVQTFALGGLVPIVIILLGIAFLMPGILGLLAGSGVLARKPWGRILTYIFAVPAILMGLLWISGAQDVVQDATDLAVGATQILYGILAAVILILNGAEFSARHAEQAVTNVSAVGR